MSFIETDFSRVLLQLLLKWYRTVLTLDSKRLFLFSNQLKRNIESRRVSEYLVGYDPAVQCTKKQTFLKTLLYCSVRLVKYSFTVTTCKY